MIPRYSRNRSKRLRKKLHVGEFQELYFDIHFVCPYNELHLDNFIQLLEINGFSCVASTKGDKDSNTMTTSAAVLSDPRKNDKLTVERRDNFVNIIKQSNIYSITSVSDICDAWYEE